MWIWTTSALEAAEPLDLDLRLDLGNFQSPPRDLTPSDKISNFFDQPLYSFVVKN